MPQTLSAPQPVASPRPVSGLATKTHCAIVARRPANPVAAQVLDLSLIETGEFVIVPLDPARIEALCTRLKLDDRPFSDMAPDCALTLRLADELGLDRFALIQTDETGWQGAQAATVYHGRVRTMAVRKGAGALNDALERIGVRPDGGRDAVDTLGLGFVGNAGLFPGR
ncbi:hypothetical protein JI664_05675 [Rhodobacter sp. NTK016B]|uniref:hypothetical protein n=1 Tax=Rhodobacter sp. NTK016B TaxID=2759676 RepID=UPI001A906F72|nr:hypothetical protein [Rhodobacter sp. NTK016B]MBN8291442.1 hypothetical protein [Rhodobacter sp. NTK016B]